jgi:SAM-dependent methyltransferase
VLEHVADVEAALENLRKALRPDGRLIAQLTGSRAVFALIDPVLPDRARHHALTRALGHPAAEKFPLARGTRTASSLEQALTHWRRTGIIPFRHGATYLSPLRLSATRYLCCTNPRSRVASFGISRRTT